jgi:uncharacterized membrane protein
LQIPLEKKPWSAKKYLLLTVFPSLSPNQLAIDFFWQKNAKKNMAQIIFIVFLIFITGCGGPNAPLSPRILRSPDLQKPEPENPQLNYTDDIKPLFQKHCSMCHLPGGSLPNWENYPTVLAKKDVIFARVVSGRSMPPQGMSTITDEERELIGQWILAGAPQE